MSKVTAIVSAYYAERYLAGRLDNLLEQEPRPEVVVVCQSGSPEHTITNKYDVRCITTPDIPTIYCAWNMAIEQATGEYITCANCDDRLYPGALARMAYALDSNPDIGIVYPDVDIVDEIGGDPVNRFAWAEGGLDRLLQGCFVGPMPMWRRSLHDTHGMFDGALHIAGDYEFWLRLMSAGVKFHRDTNPAGAYLRRADSAEHREKLRAVWETARARAKYR